MHYNWCDEDLADYLVGDDSRIREVNNILEGLTGALCVCTCAQCTE